MGNANLRRIERLEKLVTEKAGGENTDSLIYFVSAIPSSPQWASASAETDDDNAIMRNPGEPLEAFEARAREHTDLITWGRR